MTMLIVLAGVVLKVPTHLIAGEYSCIIFVFCAPRLSLTGIRGHITLLTVEAEVMGGTSGIQCKDAEILVSMP